MSWQIRPARRSEAKPLIGLYSESGCGKTLSALYLARGFVGPAGKIVMLETEAGRGEVYADVLPGSYRVCPMRGEFSPENYGSAIRAIEEETPDALIIDSASHEWEGSGGVLSMAAENEAAGKKSLMIWQGPKLAHQRHFVLRLLATPIPLVIVCMRAKYPMKEIKGTDGKKEWVRAEQVEPVQSDGILYELMIHGWIDREHRFRGTKYTRDDLRHVIRDGEPISIGTGEQLAAWAKAPATPATSAPAATSSRPAAPPPTSAEAELFGERANKLAAIDLVLASMQRKPPPDAWTALRVAICGSEHLERADPAQLDDLLKLLRGVDGREKSAIDRANGIVLAARAAAASGQGTL